MDLKRVFSPSTNATGLGAAAAAIYAAVVMIYHAVHHTGVIDPQVIVAAFSAAWLLYTRLRVTPVADPRDGNGKPLASPYTIDVAALNRAPAPQPQNVPASGGVPPDPASAGKLTPPPAAHP